jgi:glycosyltransferase involved in cell wall biosynthesis
MALVVPGFGVHDHDWCIPAVSVLSRELARTRDVVAVALRYPPSSTSTVAHGARVVPVGMGQVTGLRRLAVFRRGWQLLAGVHRERPLDVVMAIGADEPGALAVRFARRAGIPSVVMLLGGEAERRPDLGWGGRMSRVNHVLVRHAAAHADLLLAGSAPAAASLERATGRRPRVWGLGVDPGWSRSASDPEVLRGEPAVLSVASLTPVKDPLTLIAALDRVRGTHPGVVLHVVGEGPLRPEVETEIRRRGLGSHVELHGTVPHPRMPALYAGCDLVVLASWFESQGMVIEEAAAMGRVPVGTSVGVLPELHAEGTGTRWTCTPGDPNLLAAVVVDAWTASALRIREGARCRAWAAGRMVDRRVVELDAMVGAMSAPRVAAGAR